MTNLVYDTEQKRPGCVLLQAAMGGSIEAANCFPTESWLLAPTPYMRVYQCTETQLRQLTEHAWRKFAGKPDPMLAAVETEAADRKGR